MSTFPKRNSIRGYIKKLAAQSAWGAGSSGVPRSDYTVAPGEYLARQAPASYDPDESSMRRINETGENIEEILSKLRAGGTVVAREGARLGNAGLRFFTSPWAFRANPSDPKSGMVPSLSQLATTAAAYPFTFVNDRMAYADLNSSENRKLSSAIQQARSMLDQGLITDPDDEKYYREVVIPTYEARLAKNRNEAIQKYMGTDRKIRNSARRVASRVSATTMPLGSLLGDISNYATDKFLSATEPLVSEDELPGDERRFSETAADIGILSGTAALGGLGASGSGGIMSAAANPAVQRAIAYGLFGPEVAADIIDNASAGNIPGTAGAAAKGSLLFTPAGGKLLSGAGKLVSKAPVLGQAVSALPSYITHGVAPIAAFVAADRAIDSVLPPTYRPGVQELRDGTAEKRTYNDYTNSLERVNSAFSNDKSLADRAKLEYNSYKSRQGE